MPHWEGIEDANAHASRVWLAKTKSEKVWMPLRKQDCKILNDQEAWTSSYTGTPISSHVKSAPPPVRVHIEAGRATVDLSEGNIRYNFHRGPLREICAATWFVREERSSSSTPTTTSSHGVLISTPHSALLHPITDERESDQIELLYQSAVAASSSLEKGLAEVLAQQISVDQGRAVVKLVRNGPSLAMKKIPQGWFSKEIPLQRGYGEYNIDGEEEENTLGPLSHVLFVVHGIGEALFSRQDVKFPSLIDQTNATRVQLHKKQVEQWREKCQRAAKLGVPLPPVPGRIEILPIEWFDRVHDNSTALMRSLRAATLPTIPALRAIANDVVFDVLMYMTPAFCESVLECVTMQIHQLFRKIHEVFPDFTLTGGKCSLIGHSLGSVIVWDLLAVLQDFLDPRSRRHQPPPSPPRDPPPRRRRPPPTDAPEKAPTSPAGRNNNSSTHHGSSGLMAMDVIVDEEDVEDDDDDLVNGDEKRRAPNSIKDAEEWNKNMKQRRLPFDLIGVSIASQDSVEIGYQAYARQELDDPAHRGTWGPSLTKYMDQTIPFVPEHVVFLGSPLGIFLTLRGAHAVFDELRYLTAQQEEEQKKPYRSAPPKSPALDQTLTDSLVPNLQLIFSEEPLEVPTTSPFTLPAGSIYNIFHPSDPVAYRIEPLLLPQDMHMNDLPPAPYLTTPGKDVRLHVKARLLGDEIRKSLFDQRRSWSQVVESAVCAMSADQDVPKKHKGRTTVLKKEETLRFALGGATPRVDFCLQPGIIENEYVSAVTAHSSYFGNSDLQDFLINLPLKPTAPSHHESSTD